MSKLRAITDILKAKNENDELVYFKGMYRKAINTDAYDQIIDIIVSPKKPINKLDGLKKFMMDLVPDITPSEKDDLRREGKSIKLGTLYFDEKMGNWTYNQDKDGNNCESIEKILDSKNIRKAAHVFMVRRICLRPYPSEATAKKAFEKRKDRLNYVCLKYTAKRSKYNLF